MPEVIQFTVGREYRRSDLHDAYGGSRQGGMPVQPDAEPTIFQLMLAPPHQARQFWPILHAAKEETGISGILCIINRCLDLTDGGLVLVLQTARLDRETTRKIQQLLQVSQEKRPSPN